MQVESSRERNPRAGKEPAVKGVTPILEMGLPPQSEIHCVILRNITIVQDAQMPLEWPDTRENVEIIFFSNSESS